MKIGRYEYLQLEIGEVYAVARSARTNLIAYARGPLDETERPASPREALADTQTTGWLSDFEVDDLEGREDVTVIGSEEA